MKIAVYPGSFDPVTNGHLEIIRRAAALFDQLVVLVAVNATKHYLFTAEERADLLRSCTVAIPNVTIKTHDGLVALYASDINATAIVKGLRAMSDFDAEFQQSLINRQLNETAETVFLPASSSSMFLSSGMVKQVCALGGNIQAFVPPEILWQIETKIRAQAQKQS
ncbi:MAG: pantetheine-phosphate adenylyltransferase [Oscillospiraceae bacterium]|jgi:pantetheine-phosphate adenylyltransferase|nr:pantetheine-phosphate adenylyltransferase [Oscillospiraceae bacterium]